VSAWPVLFKLVKASYSPIRGNKEKITIQPISRAQQDCEVRGRIHDFRNVGPWLVLTISNMESISNRRFRWHRSTSHKSHRRPGTASNDISPPAQMNANGMLLSLQSLFVKTGILHPNAFFQPASHIPVVPSFSGIID
jgi:hypothetical protein